MSTYGVGVGSGVGDAEDTLQTFEDVDTAVQETDPRMAGFQQKFGKPQSWLFSRAHHAQNLWRVKTIKYT